MIRATIRRLRRLYERLWRADSLGFLHAETTFLRDADAKRAVELAAVRDELATLRDAGALRDLEMEALRAAVTLFLQDADAKRAVELAAVRDDLAALRDAEALRDLELAAVSAAVTTLLQDADAKRAVELAAVRDDLVALVALREVVARRDSELADVRHSVTALRDRQTELAHRLALVQTSGATREELDLLKSSLEVSPGLRDEFQEWKARHPVPARPFVSVCVATYNRAGLLLERCLPSILEQTYDHFEVIIVGDGCTDETPARVAGIRDPRVQFVNLPARGRYPDDAMRRWMVAGTPAFNHALDLARGDYVTHLDDDDEYHRDRLEKLVAFAAEHACDLVWHPFWWQPRGQWEINEGHEFAFSQVTTSSVFYRTWFTKIQWSPDAHWLAEPGDWNRFRRFKYVGPVMMRYPEPLLKHHREQAQAS